MAKRWMLGGALLLAALVPLVGVAKPVPGGIYAAAVADPARSTSDRALDAERKPAEVMAIAGVEPGMAVADYGAGGGYYTVLLADAVGPRGKVYALSPPAFHKAETWGPIEAAHKTIVPVLAPADALWLQPNSVDMVFVHLEYHDLYLDNPRHPKMDVGKVLANWHDALRKGGRVVIIDHVGRGGDASAIAGKVHRIDPARVKADLLGSGFTLERESDLLRRSGDNPDVLVFDPSVRGKTDRFFMVFKR